MIKKIINLMGGKVFFQIQSKNELIEKEIALELLINLENLTNKFNLFKEDSLISILNKNKEIPIDEDIEFLIKENINIYNTSNEKFNIFQGKKISQRKSNKNEIEKEKIIPEEIITITKNKISINDKEINLDLGGIAKGYILDKTLEKLKLKFNKTKFDILIDARGDIVLDSNKTFKIGLENPFNKDEIVETIEMKKGSIITSGHNKQKFKKGSHIIGEESDILTITLKSDFEKCYKLDYLGTYLIQLNSEKVLKKIEFDKEFEKIETLIILKNGEILKSSFW